MPSSEILQRTIATADELHSVVRTMKGLSSVSVRQYERAVGSLDQYVEAIELGFRILVREAPGALVAPPVDPRAPVGIILFGSDQGLCGAFDRLVADHGAAWVGAGTVGRGRVRLACMGLRLAAELETRDLAPELARRMPGSVDAIVGEVHELLVDIDRWRRDAGIDRVLLVHHRPAGDRGFRPVTTQLVPLDVDRLLDLADRPWPTRMLPMTRQPPAALAAALTRDLVFAALYRAFAESLASEHKARVAAMDAAEQAIDERREQLQLRFHELRQASITEELLDVSAGFEALRDAVS